MGRKNWDMVILRIKQYPRPSDPQSGRIMKIYFACTLRSLSSTSCTLFFRSCIAEMCPQNIWLWKPTEDISRKTQLQGTEHLFLKGSKCRLIQPENHKNIRLISAWAFGKEDSLILNCLLEIQEPVCMFFEVWDTGGSHFCDLKLSCQYQHWQAPFWNSLFNLVMPVGTPYKEPCSPLCLCRTSKALNPPTGAWQQTQTSPTAI